MATGEATANPWSSLSSAFDPQEGRTMLREDTMSTHTQILYHVVFSTRIGNLASTPDNRPNLFRDIWGIINKHHCHLYRINGVQDHIHILSSLHPTVALADLVKEHQTGLFKLDQREWGFPSVPTLAGWLRRLHGIVE